MIWITPLILFIVVAWLYDFSWRDKFKEEITPMKNQIESLTNQMEKFKVLDPLQIPKRLLELEVLIEQAEKKAGAAEFMAHSAKIDVAKPHRVWLYLTDGDKARAKAQKKKHESLLRRAGITKTGQA